jgi:hypothetical protein
MPYLPVAEITIAGIPLAFVLGGVTLVALVLTPAFGKLVGDSKVPFSWHVNMARLTVLVAILHGLVVYWTFF